MENRFCEILAALRREKGVSQREAAAALHISQALMSHYEKGTREPGLAFVCRACDYYMVTADYLLGRVGEAGRSTPEAAALAEMSGALRTLADRMESFIR